MKGNVVVMERRVTGSSPTSASNWTLCNHPAVLRGALHVGKEGTTVERWNKAQRPKSTAMKLFVFPAVWSDGTCTRMT
jgi:hypothetical protein